MNNKLDFSIKEQKCISKLKDLLLNVINLFNTNENESILTYAKEQIELINREKNINMNYDAQEYGNLVSQLCVQTQKSIILFLISLYSNNIHLFNMEEVYSLFDDILTKFIEILFKEMNFKASYFVYLITFIQDSRLIKYLIAEYAKLIAVLIKLI